MQEQLGSIKNLLALFGQIAPFSLHRMSRSQILTRQAWHSHTQEYPGINPENLGPPQPAEKAKAAIGPMREVLSSANALDVPPAKSALTSLNASLVHINDNVARIEASEKWQEDLR